MGKPPPIPAPALDRIWPRNDPCFAHLLPLLSLTPADDELYPIAVLIDELKNDDTEVRFKAVKRLTTIASNLGPDRTRAELIPYLTENTEDEDEILVILADQLGDFVPLVGGADHAALVGADPGPGTAASWL